MTTYCTLSVSGVDIGKRAKDFGNAINKVATGAHCKKHQNLLNANFRRYLEKNTKRAGIYEDDIEDSFYVKIVGNHIQFGNTNAVVANKYEYGWEDDIDDDDYMSDYASMSPRYFIRPAIRQVANDLAEILKQDVYKEYEKTTGNMYSTTTQLTDIPQKHNYMNKYDGVL